MLGSSIKENERKMISILFDTETTGLLKPSAVDVSEQPHIIDIFCLKVNVECGLVTILDEFESLVKPPIPISDEITRITRIDNSMVKDAPAFEEIAKPLAEFFLGTEELVAHNLSFDRSMLTNELFRCNSVLNFPWPINHTCTVERTMYIEQRRMSLTNLYKELFDGKSFPDAHRARPDVMAMFECYRELVKQGVI
tara:strand:- start:92 stop:679 length:588 start_codon:yes stop_codon:yes gene_type:complete